MKCAKVPLPRKCPSCWLRSHTTISILSFAHLYAFHMLPGGHREYEVYWPFFCFVFPFCGAVCLFLLSKCSTTELYVQPPDLEHILLLLFLYVCVEMCTRRGQGTILRSWFSPATL